MTISRFFGFLISNLVFFFGLKDKIVEFILGFGKKQFFEISKCFVISRRQLLNTANLLRSPDLSFAIRPEETYLPK